MAKPLLWALAVFILLIFVACAFAGRWLVSAASSPSVLRVNRPNPALQSAIKEARQTLPLFMVRLKSPAKGDRFAIRAGFKTPFDPEYLWLKDPAISPDGFRATVDETPMAVPGLHKGDVVSVKKQDVVDWLIRRANGDRAGGFTNLALSGGG